MSTTPKEIASPMNEPETHTAVVVHPEPQHPTSEIGAILRLAIDRPVPVPIETIERLVALKERVDARDAAAEFNRAMADFQAECPSIQKTSAATITTKSGGQFGYHYAELDEIARVCRPLLTKHGLSYSWDSEMDGTKIKCTCTVRHVAGHAQTATFTCPTESESAMSGQQRHAAALTYARRQSLVQVLGLTTTDQDTDGESRERITATQAFDIEDLIRDADADRGKFLAYMQVDCVDNILARDLKKATTALQDKIRKDKAKKGGAVA